MRLSERILMQIHVFVNVTPHRLVNKYQILGVLEMTNNMH
jgi:hypothetical protein